MKERIVREVGYGLSVEGASAAALVKGCKPPTECAQANKQRPEFKSQFWVNENV